MSVSLMWLVCREEQWLSHLCCLDYLWPTWAYSWVPLIAGCDKNMPGCLIAMARLNRPSIMVYGGSIKPGHSALTGEPLDIVSAFQSYGAHAAGLTTEEQRFDVVRHACPGA